MYLQIFVNFDQRSISPLSIFLPDIEIHSRYFCKHLIIYNSINIQVKYVLYIYITKTKTENKILEIQLHILFDLMFSILKWSNKRIKFGSLNIKKNETHIITVNIITS